MRNLAESGIDPKSLGIETKDETEEGQQNREVREVAQEGRARLLMAAIQRRTREMWNNPVIQKFLNYAPLAGDLVMGYKAVRGSEAGRQLSAKERFLYAGAVAASLTSYYHLERGNLTAAAASHSLSQAFTHVESLPALAKQAAAAIQERQPDLANILVGVSEFVAQHKAQLADLKDLFGSSLTELKLS